MKSYGDWKIRCPINLRYRFLNKILYKLHIRQYYQRSFIYHLDGSITYL